MLSTRLLASARLAVAAFVLTFAVGIPLGVASAVRRGGIIDRFVKVFALVGMSTPSFWIGILLIQIFAVTLGWLPTGTAEGADSIVLPAITLALFGTAGVTRLVRSTMLDCLDSEFVKLARAKGLSESVVILRHALRNSLLPVVSFGGLFFVNLVTLTLVVETVFSWPGMGTLTYTAIVARDFPVIQGVTLVAGAIAIFVNLIIDILYVYLDPRIRYAAR
jgi:peptide/nickel transport system permease protein